MSKEYKIAVIGLGYVGLPLAALFAKRYPVIGYDISEKRISELQNGYDVTRSIHRSIKQCLKDIRSH